MSLYNELKRRNIFKVAAAYAIVSWLLLQVSDTLAPALHLPDWFHSSVALLLILGFPVALILAWAFELTPEGIKRDYDVDRSQSIASKTGRKLDFIIIGLLVLTLGYFAYDKFVLDPERDAVLVDATTEAVSSELVERAIQEPDFDKSIAVLPFVNMSSDIEQEYFSDGLSEEVLNLLAKIPDLRVIARTSSFAYKGKDIKIADVADELNVGHVLEGSVRKSGNQLRITAQLIRASDSSHLWSETYDRTLDNIFVIQDEIAAAVVAHLKISLLGAAPAIEETDPEAYRLALQAKYFWNRRSPGDEEKAMEYYQQALDVDPDYALAWAGLSVAYAVQALDGRISRETGLLKAREAVEMALSLDPGSSDAHVRMAQAYSRDDNQEAARREYQLALDLDPNSPLALGAMASSIWKDGYLEEGIKLYKNAEAIDPLAPIWPGNMAHLFFLAGRLDEAEEAARKALELSPESNSGQTLAAILLFRGQFDESLELTESIPESPNKTFDLMVTYQAMGRQAESDAAMKRLISGPGGQDGHLIAEAYASRDEIDKAFDWLNKAHEERNLRFGVIKFDPYLKNLHGDPRWDAFIAKLETLL